MVVAKGRTICQDASLTSFKQPAAARSLLQNFGVMFVHLLGGCLSCVCFVWCMALEGRWLVVCCWIFVFLSLGFLPLVLLCLVSRVAFWAHVLGRIAAGFLTRWSTSLLYGDSGWRLATMWMLAQLCHRDFEFTWVNLSLSFGGNFCLRDFEFTRVIFTIFWSMSLREAYVDGLMWRWRLKACDDVDVGTILSQRSRISLGKFFVIFWLELCLRGLNLHG